MTKEQAYQELFKLDNQGVCITEAISQLASCETPPDMVIRFINEHTIGCPEFIANLSDKKFYKTLLDESATINDKAKALSSLVTHTLIEHSQSNTSLIELSRSVKAPDILDALSRYLSGNSSKLESVCTDLRLLFTTSKER